MTRVTKYALLSAAPDGQTSIVTSSDGEQRAETPVRMGAAIQRVAAIVRRIVGVPDYERYVARVQERHAGVVPMTREEFETSRLNDKYSRPGQRCC